MDRMEKEIEILSKKLQIFFSFEEVENLAELDMIKKLLNSLAEVGGEFLVKNVSNQELDNFVLNISLCNEITIQNLNREHRNKDKVTDVLSFPMQDSIRDGEFEILGPSLEVGDIIICHEVCEKQADEFNITYTEEFIHLCVHGFLHLCGYDHEISQEEEELMENLEKQLLETISRHKDS